MGSTDRMVKSGNTLAESEVTIKFRERDMGIPHLDAKSSNFQRLGYPAQLIRTVSRMPHALS